MDAGNVASGRLEESERGIADQREIQVARARSVGVERLSVLPSPARDGAAPQDHGRAGRHDVVDRFAKLLEEVGPAAERQPDHVRPFFLIRAPALYLIRSRHDLRRFKRRARKFTIYDLE